MNVIKTLAHHTWGANRKSLLSIYKSLILSKIKYWRNTSATPKRPRLTYLLHQRKSATNHIAYKTFYNNSSTFSTNVGHEKSTYEQDIFTKLQK